MIEAFRLFGEISLRGGEAVERGLNNVSNTAQSSARGMGGVGKALLGVGSAMAGTALAQGFIGVTSNILNVTNELQAMNGQYEQVMGSMKGTTDKYIDSMAKKWGKHPNDLKSTMMQYYAILKGKGLSEQEAYTTAQKYMTATVDGNAFANEDMASTTARFMGMIKGEYDSVDGAMVNMSQTMLNDEAQKQYGKKWENLSVSQQETLKTSIALKQQLSAGVTGQGEREADSYANKVALLNNKWKEFQAVIGAPIIGAVAGIFDTLGGALEKVSNFFTSLSPSTQQFIVVTALLSVGLTAVGLVLAGVVMGMMSFATATGIAMSTLVLATGGIILVIPLIIGLIYLLIKNWDTVKAKTIEVWNAVWDKIKAFGNWLLNNTAIGTFIKTIITNWDTIKKTTTILWSTLKALFQVGVNYIKEKLGPIASFVKGIFDKVKSAMEGPIKKAKETVMGIIDAIKGAFNKMHITIPKPKIPHVSVSVGHKSIKGVDIPYPKFDVNWRAKGGYFNAPTLFGAGEKGNEVLMPLDHRKNMQPFSSAVAENLKDFFAPLMGGGLGAATGGFNIVVPLNVNGREIARAVAVNIDQELKRQADIKKRGI